MEQKELCWRERGRLWLRLTIRVTLMVGALLLLFLAVPPLFSLFMPFVLAFFIAWLLNPLVRLLQKKLGVSRKILSLFLVLLIFGIAGFVLFAFLYNIGIEIFLLANNWNTLWDGLRATIEQGIGAFSGVLNLLPVKVGVMAEGLLNQFAERLQTFASALLGSSAAKAGIWAMGVPSFAVALVVFMMGSYFITADYPHIRFLVTEHMSPEVRKFFRLVKITAGAAFGGYFRAQFILSVGVFFILALGFFVIAQPYSLLLAFLLAVLDFIPIVGAGTVMLPWGAVLLFTGDLRAAVSLMVIWGVIVLFRRVGEPKVLGSQTGLSPVLSLVSIYVGMRLAGVPGMILGPILLLVVLNICKSGLFDATVSDLKLATRDICALLKNRPKP